MPVAVDNDAKALALAEGWVGGAVGEDNYLAMVVSTGIGGGIVLNGLLLDGADGNAGHIGHIFVAEGGRLVHSQGTRIVPSPLGADGGLIGAAAVAARFLS